MGAIVRAQVWWAPKVLPAVAAGALGALVADTDPGPGLVRFAVLLTSAAGLGTAAHIVNDWADIDADTQIGRANAMAPRAPSIRAAHLVLALCLGILPWVPLRPGPAVWGLVALLVVAPFGYSAPPLRAKARGTAGVVLDAVNAHLAPVLISFLALVDTGSPSPRTTETGAALAIWSFAFGIRSILAHQRRDEPGDRAARVRTYVVLHGSARAQAAARRAFAVELVALGLLAVLAATEAMWAVVALGAYLVLLLPQLRWLPRPLDPAPADPAAWMPLAEFYGILPVATFSIALVGRDRAWWPVLVAEAVLFAGPAAKQLVDLRKLVVEGARLVLWQVRVQWYDGPIGRVRGSIRLWVLRQARRFRRIVLRRPPAADQRAVPAAADDAGARVDSGRDSTGRV